MQDLIAFVGDHGNDQFNTHPLDASAMAPPAMPARHHILIGRNGLRRNVPKLTGFAVR
jgi:hypothetical protein